MYLNFLNILNTRSQSQMLTSRQVTHPQSAPTPARLTSKFYSHHLPTCYSSSYCNSIVSTLLTLLYVYTCECSLCILLGCQKFKNFKSFNRMLKKSKKVQKISKKSKNSKNPKKIRKLQKTQKLSKSKKIEFFFFLILQEKNFILK